MRPGVLLAQRITPGLSHAPRYFARPRVPTVACRHLRQLHVSSSAAKALKTNTGETSKASDFLADTEKKGPAAEVDTKEPGSARPPKDLTWVFDHAEERITTLQGVGTEGTEEYVTDEAGAKLISSWSIASGDTPVMWVPGDAPRLRNMEVPVTLEPESTAEAAQDDVWPMGPPQSSFEPFFASLAAMNPRVNFDQTDVIARASELHKLVGFARGNMKDFGVGNSAFGFQFQVVKNTLLVKLLLNTRKNYGKVLGRGMSPTVQGAFLNKVTQMRPSEAHVSPDYWQAIRYGIGPLRCVAITPVDAGGNHSLPRVKFHGKSPLMPRGAGSVDVREGGLGVAPSAVAHVHTGFVDKQSGKSIVSPQGHLRLKPTTMLKLWLQRCPNIVQGQLEGSGTANSSEETARLSRVSLRNTKHMFELIQEEWQLDLRRLVTILDQLRDTAKRAGGPCILTYQPPKRECVGGPVVVPPKFEIFKCGPGAGPVVLDWHVKQFWSRD